MGNCSVLHFSWSNLADCALLVIKLPFSVCGFHGIFMHKREYSLEMFDCHFENSSSVFVQTHGGKESKWHGLSGI